MKQSWEVKTLKDVGRIFSGNSINATVKKEKYLNLSEGFPYIATKDIGYDSIIDYENGVRIPFSEKNSFRIAPKNSVLICAEGGSAGRKIGQTNQEICFVNKLFALLVNNKITSKYVYYWYHTDTFQKEFKSRLTGIIGGVSKKKFETIPIPIAPPHEQEHIITKLDECFGTIEQAKAKIKLNLNHTFELFQSIIQALLYKKPNQIIDGQVEQVEFVPLSNLLFEQPRNGWSPPAKYHSKVGIPVLTLSAVTGFNYDGTKVKFTSAPTDKNAHYWLKEDDILITRSNTKELVGHVALYDGYPQKVICCDLIKKMKGNSKIVEKKYIYYCIMSLRVRKYIAKMAKGASSTMKKIDKKIVQEIQIPFIPISEQRRIVEKLENFRSESQSLESNYQQELNALDELKKSILQKAFNGELTTIKKEATV